MAVVVRADVSLGADDRAATRAARPAGSHDGRDLPGERFRRWQCRAAREHWILIVFLFDIVREDSDLAALLVVTDRHLAHQVLRGRRWNRALQAGRLLGYAAADEASGAELLDQLLDRQPQRLELLFLHPQGDDVTTGASDQPEPALPGLPDSFSFQDRQLVVFVAMRWHASVPSRREGSSHVQQYYSVRRGTARCAWPISPSAVLGPKIGEVVAAWKARRCPGDLWGGLGDRVPTEGGGSTIVAEVGTCALSCAVLQLLAGALPFE